MDENTAIARTLQEILSMSVIESPELRDFWVGWIESGKDEARDKGVAY